MAEHQLELLQLDNGDVVLQRPATAGDELVRVRFAPELLHMLGDDIMEVAQAMMEAAADAVSDLNQNSDEPGEMDGWELICGTRGPVLH